MDIAADLVSVGKCNSSSIMSYKRLVDVLSELIFSLTFCKHQGMMWLASPLSVCFFPALGRARHLFFLSWIIEDADRLIRTTDLSL